MKVVDKGAIDNRQNVSIVLVDEKGDDKSRWDLSQCWPKKYNPTDFNAKNNEVAMETLEICTEYYKKVK